jgi:hypothetical protein
MNMAKMTTTTKMMITFIPNKPIGKQVVQMIPNQDRIYKMKFSSVYPLYVAKAEKKGRTIDEVNSVISWLTGYNIAGIQEQIALQSDFETFFNRCPQYHPNASLIKGVICGYRVEEIEDPIVQKVRHLDKLIDELAKGKSLDKILRRTGE